MSELIYNVEGVFNEKNPAGCLNQYGCIAYRIPPYQRGYKWGSENGQPVERLFSDLKQAWSSKKKEYLLQAITVKKIRDGDNGWLLEVIDGQQRLTTLFILIQVLNFQINKSISQSITENKLRYSIRHENQTLDTLVARWIKSVEELAETSESFDRLKNAQEVDREKQQDIFYLKCATLRCVHELATRSSDSVFLNNEQIVSFNKFVLEDVKLMVNAVEAHVSGEKIFGNLNSNRVVLTETELIKGLMLTRVARNSKMVHPRRYREILEMRIQLGRKWDELIHWTKLPEIRSLYFRAFNDGMIGLLELVARQLPEPFKAVKSNNGDEKLLFEFFLRQHDFEEVFRLLVNTFSRMQDWHANDQSFHLLGYCLMHQKDANRVSFIVKQLGCKTKAQFTNGLYDQRKSILFGSEETNGDVGRPNNVNFDKLKYGENNPQIQSILLALSVFQKVNDGRFNFHAYQDEDWTLEHIFPQTPFGKEADLTEAQNKAALAILTQDNEKVLGGEIAKSIDKIAQSKEESDPGGKINELLRSVPLLHQIGNLCLLIPEDNSSMGCKMFNEKRKIIRNRIAQGSFVPRHTYEVFSKMIGGEDDNLQVWSGENIKKHQEEIARRLKDLMEEKA